MTTVLSAVRQAGDATNPARVLLSVTGAPVPETPRYASNFTTTDDGWTGTAGTFLLNAGEATVANNGMELQGPLDRSIATFSRTVTGLSIGQTYRYSVMARGFRGTIALGVSGMTSGAYMATMMRTLITYAFVASATSHVIQAKVKAPTSGPDNGVYWIDTVVVVKTSGWQGTTIFRQDANGIDMVVRESPEGQDTVAGVMTVTDYEAALTGLVGYWVRDGLGGTATATLPAPSTPGVWLTLPATSNPATPTPPAFVEALLVTGFDESSDSNGSMHQVIGRADPIANPGPLAMRSGSVNIWCTDYAAAKAVRALLANGDVAHLRQPSFPGMDVYLVARRVGIRAEEITATQRWIATVDYQEVTPT